MYFYIYSKFLKTKKKNNVIELGTLGQSKS